MPEKKRAFIAVRFSDEVVSALERITQRLKGLLESRVKVKWVEPKNIHLTLQFLGEVDSGLLPELSKGLSGAALSKVQPFEVALSGVGAFPSASRPRVIWVGMHSGADQMKTLAWLVQQVTGPLGYPPEDRPFAAHVTLGRLKDPKRSGNISGELEKMSQADAGKCRIDAVHLVASELRPSGPIYTILDSFPLGQ